MSLRKNQLTRSSFAVNTDQLGNQSELLKDIKDNTAQSNIFATNPQGVATTLKTKWH